MKENEIELKIQALVDGELTEFEAGKLRDRIKNDVRLQVLHERLMQMKDLISKHEMPRVLPESSDFYWSKISQKIEVGGSAAQSSATEGLSIFRSDFQFRAVQSFDNLVDKKQTLQNEYVLAKIDADTAEKEPCKISSFCNNFCCKI